MSTPDIAALGVLDSADGKVLLGWKLRGFGTGRLTVPGGRTMAGETTAEALVREFAEECQLTVEAGPVLATIAFTFADDPGCDFTATVHRVVQPHGVPRQTEELRPEWFALADVPWSSMWPDTALWLPRVVGGETITASFRYRSSAGTLLAAHLRAG